MGLINNTVHYCCVSRDNQILYAYNGGDQSNESLAGLCLEKTPPFHAWYFESIGKRRFGFLIGDGFVYFAIVDEALGKLSVLKFLEHLRDEFKKAARKGSFTAVVGSVNVDDVVSKLIASLEHVAAAETANNELKNNNSNNLAEQSEAVSSSTKAPLLGKSSKQEKKRGGKDHVVSVRGIELDEHRSSERCEASSAAETSLQKECVPRRGRSGSQSFECKWRRLVQIVLAIDAAICLTLFCIWLAVCEGIKCTRS
ncbi:SNARE-like superfamily protein [Raphanus sativus]|uniref:Phytolongin Phyl1.1 n=1 Tax=Raphanus sativus TaxID=3726 RepID=A0A6J0MKW2_RAPSA|nr:phytolongin Phyl1.1 [Raphanus sativus]KAJ4905885.1 SNARE-like superfamily protein [Raphanus sativus]